jgi:hypothetical protein
MARIREGLMGSQAQAFPSWRSVGGFGRRAQSGAALAACGLRPKADVRGSDGKAVGWVGMLVVGGVNVR